MGTCKYREKYLESDHGPELSYTCPFDAISYYDSTMCKDLCHFHDDTYALNHSKEVMDKLDKHIDGIELTLKVGDISEPILCIGFNIPEEVNFSDREFRHPIYFARAVFHKKAIFKGVKFCEIASFHYAKFYEQAIFRNTIFKQEANFSNVHFKSNVKFIGTPAAPKNGDISLDLYTNFEGFANFFRTEFDKQVSFSGAKFNKFNGKNSGANFTHINFKGEVDFDSSAYYFSIFPSPSKSYDQLRTEQDAPIKFDDTTFREREPDSLGKRDAH